MNLKEIHKDADRLIDKFINDKISADEFETLAAISAIVTAYPDKFGKNGKLKSPEDEHKENQRTESQGDGRDEILDDYRAQKETFKQNPNDVSKRAMLRALDGYLNLTKKDIQDIYKEATTPEEKRAVKDKLQRVINTL